MNLYITADAVGQWTGGGKVTFHETEAFKHLGPCEVYDYAKIHPNITPGDVEPWGWDNAVERALQAYSVVGREYPKLTHVYSGTFSKTIKLLKSKGCKITQTAEAHDVEKSKKENELLGIPFDYLHLTDPKLWAQYLQGYLDADVLICPSTHSTNVMRGFGAKQTIEIVPHGVDLPATVSDLPKQFVVGYIGVVAGGDKGVKYLLEAWKRLNYKDAVLKIAGQQSDSFYGMRMLSIYGGGNVQMVGFVKDTKDFFDSVSLLVQPSVTEGFGLTVLEAMGHGRPVLCSTGAGAVDLVPKAYRFEAKNVDEMCQKIDHWKNNYDKLNGVAKEVRGIAEQYSWKRMEDSMERIWRGLLHE